MRRAGASFFFQQALNIHRLINVTILLVTILLVTTLLPIFAKDNI